MSTTNSIQNNDAIPNIRDRKDVIVLSATIKCQCGRTKERAHCPVCGKIKLYGRAVTEMAQMPNGDVVKDCKTYRCSGCAEVFNDVAWYFNCHAPEKIDWEAQRIIERQKKRREAEIKWIRRIEIGEKFDFNDRTKCKAEAGFDPEERREQMKLAEARYNILTPEQKVKVDKQRAIARGEALEEDSEIELQLMLAKRKAKLENHIADCNYCNSHEDNCDEAKRIENGEA